MPDATSSATPPATFGATSPLPPIARPPAVNAWFQRPSSERLSYVVDLMRDLSCQTEPEAATALYGERVGPIFNADVRISLSRRDLDHPYVRITNSPRFTRPSNPWQQRDRLPLVKGGLLAELLYGGEPRIINDVTLDPADPAAEHLAGVRSLTAIPLFDGGVSTHMVVICRFDAGAFNDDHLPEHVWLSNLFGRATANLVMKRELQVANDRLNKELATVADIQRSLLPDKLPDMDGIDIAAHYRTSQHAGGDYYDFTKMPDGRLAMIIADVSGHGTPAAVMMAITHTLTHTSTPDLNAYSPKDLLTYINRHLCEDYTKSSGTFVTAFAGVYDPATRELCFSSAGHNPPRLKPGHGGPAGIVESDPCLPLGIDADEVYHDASQRLGPGDTLVLYTDGITEARRQGQHNGSAEQFGTDRLDAAIAVCSDRAHTLVDCIVESVRDFSGPGAPQDDQTLLVLRV